MEPASGLFDGAGASIANAPGVLVLACVTILAAIAIIGYLIAKYIQPSKERIKMRELEIRAAENETKQEQIKASQALAEQVGAQRESVDAMSVQVAAMNAGVDASKARSAQMGEAVNRIDLATAHAVDTVDDTNAKVTEMHAQIRDIYNMQNRRV